MKMTDVERTILIRLHEVLMALKPKEAKEHEVAIQILREGYHEDLYEQCGACYLSEPFPEKDQKFVYDVLDLYTSMNRSFRALPKGERRKVDKERLRFPGFDATDEAASMAFANFVIKKQGRWSDLDHKGEYKSEAPMLPRYERMLAVARKLKSDHSNYRSEELVKLLDQADPKPERKTA